MLYNKSHPNLPIIPQTKNTAGQGLVFREFSG